MYDREHPANDINELYEYLKKEHTQNYCYRGQTKEYNYLVPSIYRKYILSNEAEIHDIRINEDLSITLEYDYLSIDPTIDDNDKKGRKKLSALRRLVKKYGSAIGNILAQQYGITSECIDITSDLDIACFFATREWPKYSITTKDGLGIIYRFKVNNEKVTYEEVDIRKRMSYDFEFKNVPFLFSNRIDSYSKSELNYLRSKQKFDKKVELTSPFIVLSYDQIKYIFESYKEKNKDDSMVDYIDSSRWNKQKGGLIIPSRVFLGLVDSSSKPDESPVSKVLFMNPSVALLGKMIGINDTSKYSFVEKFYFKQNGLTLKNEKITKENLWPSLEEDYIFKTISLNERKLNDLIDVEEIYDIEKGIIDRGYYD